MARQSSRREGRREPGSGGLREALEPLDRALLDHHRGRDRGPVRVAYDTGEVDELPPGWFFRGPRELEPVERAAVDTARGRILDVGAGAGAIALALQERDGAGPVTALELLPRSVAILRDRGVETVIHADLWTAELPPAWDTVLALMNGTGLAGTRRRLPALVRRLGGWVAEGGSLLVDGSDLRAGPGGGEGAEAEAGELQIQLEYAGLRGPPFPHLFADPDTLERAAASVGWRAEVISRDGERYLARLTRRRVGEAPRGDGAGGPPPPP